MQGVSWDVGNTWDLVRYDRVKETKKIPTTCCLSQNWKTDGEKKLAENTFSFTYTMVTLPDKIKGPSQNLRNFIIKNAMVPQNSKNTI